MLFANYQYRGDAGSAQSSNKFDVERAYLTFRMPAGENLAVRITADVFQQTNPGSDSFYRGWVFRAKYAYLQYDFLKRGDWRAYARAGLLQTVIIEHDEQFWPRWISVTPVERAGFFSSADGGVSTSIGLPRGLGEIYATLTNGPGFTSRETDRFKDYAARLTLKPWGHAKGALGTVALSAWGYRGATASRFVDGGAGQIGSIGSALRRDRWGIHLGGADPRLTFGVQYAERMEESERGANTLTVPRIVIDSTRSLKSGYVLLRPAALVSASFAAPLTILLRGDRIEADDPQASAYNVVIAGLIWDLSKRASISLDYQENTPVRGDLVSPLKIYFAHLVVRF